MFLAPRHLIFSNRGRICRPVTQTLSRSASLITSSYLKSFLRQHQKYWMISKMSCMSVTNLCVSPTKGKGQVQVIFGPMFSGKSTELLRRIRRYQIANQDCLVIKYAKDNRYSTDEVATHDKQAIPAIKATKLLNINTSRFSVIGVDEGQFFEDIVPFAEIMADRGKIVIVAALDGTFERKPFGTILNLIPIAESVIKLSAVCNTCFREAAFTKRISNEKEVEVIGGSDKYLAVCRQCYHKATTFTGVENIDAARSVRKTLNLKRCRSPFSAVNDGRRNPSFQES